jgi:hypothetical protein
VEAAREQKEEPKWEGGSNPFYWSEFKKYNRGSCQLRLLQRSPCDTILCKKAKGNA